ncbi:DNA replication regulator SLD3-domain-containing protein [Elsinoe ampelina]|uniref:DNA replication regulator SLD3-domain-containing protein n=1 Tax=Elsinoe ampelina TaxID=302913 RepID=A0A6A6G6Z5_9PEZI|nr:DNA replication regulator SLD3-domain-containing protein [Elsinoe ampelina]
MNDLDPRLHEPRKNGTFARPAAARGQKRKHVEETEPELDRRPIHITGGSAESPETIVLRPIRLIARAQLPLSFLYPGKLENKRFRSAISCLEGRENAQQTPLVLLVEDDKRRLHAVERVQEKVYAICRLAEHIKSSDFPGKPIETGNYKKTKMSTQDGQPWWASAAIEMPVPLPNVTRKVPKLDILVAAKQPLSTNLPALLDETSAKIPGNKTGKVTGMSDEEIDSVQATIAFVQHYLEMLYKSKISVAYFAKAHIPRLRNSMQIESRAGKVGMIEFLQALILSPSTFDKKHKSLWLEKTKDILPRTILKSPESQDKPVKKASKKKVKVKPNKAGCLPDEEEHFTHWWLNGEDTPASNETIEGRYKRRSLGLRTREAFLQLIIMLEVCSLQKTQTAGEQGVEIGEEAQPAKPKAKDNTVTLELLLDKLCIWHSVDSTMSSASDEKDATAKKAPDQLRNFCIEVIVPFYMSKAPDVALSVNKKLGGPSASSTKRRGTSSSETTKASGKSKREPLQRVPSEKISSKRQMTPSLIRSATDSQLVPGIKREPGELSLDSIPLKADLRGEPRRSSTLDKMKLRQREVDFDAMSQAQESRRKKQVEVENKLKEAISALKKPNRVLAGKELADVAEQRELMAQAREKASKAQRARQRQQIQVNATPKHSRIRPDLITTTPPAKHTTTDTRHPHSSSTISRIASSGIRPHAHDFDENGILETGHRPRHLTVEATPLTGISKFVIPALPQSAMKQPLFTCADVGSGQILETPVKMRDDVEALGKGNGGGGVSLGSTLVTPSKNTLQHPDDPASRAMVDETPKRDEDIDIYAALGWDD